MQERLVEEGDVGGGRDAAAARAARRRGRPGSLRLSSASSVTSPTSISRTPRAASSSSGVAGSPDEHEVGDAGPARRAAGPSAKLVRPSGSSTRVRRASVWSLPGDGVDELGEHPVGGGGVVLVLRARPSQLSRQSANAARRPSWVSHRGGPSGACGKPGRVLEHVVEGDGVLAVRAELGDEVGDRLLGRERALAEELPDQRRDERLGGREDREAGVEVGVAEGLVHEHLAVEGEGHLAGGQQAVVDVAAGPGEQGVDGSSDRGWSCAGTLVP